MTPEERAEKIARELYGDLNLPLTPEMVNWKNKIAAQIREAEKDAFDDGVNESLRVSSCDDCFKKGRASMREDAAKVAENNVCGLDICSTSTAEAIRAIPVEGGMKEKWGKGLKPPTDLDYSIFCIEAALLLQMEKLHLGRSQFARKCGMKKSNMSRLLNNFDGSIRLRNLLKIIDKLGMAIKIFPRVK